MPACGPVYQPTTVSYEQHQYEWSSPITYLGHSVGGGLKNTRCVRWLLIALGLFSLSAGLIVVTEATVDYSDNKQNKLEDEHGNVAESEDKTGKLIMTFTGSFLIVIGLVFLGLYYHLVRRGKKCFCLPCLPTKEERLARQLDNQVSNGQILTLNPSTDLLVAAQYGPVSEIAYQPPQHDVEETRKLMANDNKECTDESERMLESDPRIVLRPLSHTEEA